MSLLIGLNITFLLDFRNNLTSPYLTCCRRNNCEHLFADVNECENPSVCGGNRICLNTWGTYYCVADSGKIRVNFFHKLSN